jgi:hypothetical protein
MRDWADEEARKLTSKPIMLHFDIPKIGSMAQMQEHATSQIAANIMRQDDERKALATALRAAERRGHIAGLKEASDMASRFPASYDDGASLHAENMTAARIRIDLLARATALEASE